MDERELERLRDQLEQMRKERNFALIAAYGFGAVLCLAVLEVRRSLVWGAGALVFLVCFFVKCRWGIGDSEMSFSQALGTTLGLAAVMVGAWLIWVFWAR
jgi:hypothetical protein